MSSPSAERLDSIHLHFLVGMGRSGTTLLTSVLNYHPELLSTPENNFLIFNYPAFRNSTFLKNDVALLKRSLRYKSSKTPKIWHPTSDYVNQLFDKNHDLNFNRLSKLLYLFYPLSDSKQNIKCIIDKNPEYSLHVDELKKQFPSSKFIILIRDYRANIASRKKADKSLLRSLTILAESWNHYYRKLKKFAEKNPDSVLTLRYEDFVQEPELWTRTLCEFLEVSFDERMLEQKGSFADNFIVAGVNLTEDQKMMNQRMHGNLNLEINTHQTENWKSELRVSEIKLLDYLCRPVAQRFYDLDPQDKLPVLKRTFLFLRTFPLVLFTRFYLITVDYYFNYLPLRMKLIFKEKL